MGHTREQLTEAYKWFNRGYDGDKLTTDDAFYAGAYAAGVALQHEHIEEGLLEYCVSCKHYADSEDGGQWSNNGKHPMDPDRTDKFTCNKCIAKTEAAEEMYLDHKFEEHRMGMVGS